VFCDEEQKGGSMKKYRVEFDERETRLIDCGRKTQKRFVIQPQPEVLPDGTVRFPWATFYANGLVHTFDRKGAGGENWSSREFPKENKFSQALRRTPYWNPSPFGMIGDWWVCPGTRGLRITDLWVERIQDISLFGVARDFCPDYADSEKMLATFTGKDYQGRWCAAAWNKLNGEGAWERNDWVWVYEFHRL
jgi:hypothetical protein